ncbi:MAG: replicative DNA helicase [Candidatus Omnitrophica bacterium]|nr:replicative DNA helicase [Candidatus Omnitrophota bacterium]
MDRQSITQSVSSAVLEKLPPQNLEAEQAVLGAMLLHEDAVAIALEMLEEAGFYKQAHRIIFRAIQALFSEHKPVDLVTLSEALKTSGELDQAGGLSVLTNLVNAVPTTTNIQHYARIVREKAVLRHLIHAASQIVSEGYDAQDDVESFLDRAEHMIFEITSSKSESKVIPLRELIKDSIEAIDKLYQRKAHVTGIATGLHELDILTAGLQKGDLIVMAGRPSMGKSALVSCIAEHAAIIERVPTVIFSLEMSKEQMVQRLLCAHARVDAHKVRTGFLAQSDWPRLTHAAGKLSEAPLFIDDTSGLSVMELRAKSRRLKSQHNIGLIVVDYLQMMRGPQRSENRQQEISDISRSLKGLAKELNVPVIAVSQLSRSPERREDRRPQLADLRECLTGDTAILHAESGESHALQDLYERQLKIPVLTLTSDWTLQKTIPAAVVRSGVKPVFRLRTATGREIRASGNHPFLTVDGWVVLKRLAPGIRIAVPRHLPIPGLKGFSQSRARLLGYLLSDGHYGRRRTVGFINNDPVLLKDAEQIVQEEFGVPARHKPHWSGSTALDFSVPGGFGPGKNPLTQWIKTLGIHGQLGPAKRVPVAVFQSSYEIIAAFLAGLYAGDGSVVRRRDRYPIKYVSTSRGLLGDVQALLLRLGILAVLGSPTRHTKSTMDIAELVVEGREQVARFAALIPMSGRKAIRLKEASVWAQGGMRHNHHIDRLPLAVTDTVRMAAKTKGFSWSQLGYRCQGKEMDRATLGRVAQTLESPCLQQLARSDVLWDRIVAIEPAGKEMTYDLMIPKTHNFIANHMIVHNSGAIEQDADLVALLFREEFYLQTDENRGVAELIIAKQRNGPVDTLKLAFIREYTRFENLSRRSEPA